MALDKTDKRILVVSDDKRLSRAIELNVHSRLAVDIVIGATGPLEQAAGWMKNGDLDLIMVAASSPSSEPVVTLARARLAHHIGRIPILLISDRPVAPALDTKIDHLASPFGTNELCEVENTAATEEMSASASEVSLAIENIAAIAEENSAAAEEVSATVEEMTAQMEEITASAQSLSAMAQELQALVTQFRLPGAGDPKTREQEEVTSGKAKAPSLAGTRRAVVPAPVTGTPVARKGGNGYEHERL